MKKKKKSSWKKQLIVLLVIAVAVFVTVQLTGQRQTTDQRASEGEVVVSPTECKTVTLASYTTTKCSEGTGVNTVNYVCSDGFTGTLGGAACYGEAQMIAYAKNSCEARSNCQNTQSISAPTPTYVQTQ